MQFEGEWENVKMWLQMEPSLSFVYVEEIEISPEMGSQRKDYHGTYTLYNEEVINDEVWKVMELECRWRDEHNGGMEPSDKVFNAHLSFDGSQIVIHHKKRGHLELNRV